RRHQGAAQAPRCALRDRPLEGGDRGPRGEQAPHSGRGRGRHELRSRSDRLQDPRQRRRDPGHSPVLRGDRRGGDRGPQPLGGAPARGGPGADRRGGDGGGRRRAGAVSLELVKDLRERTGAGLLDCQKALAECGGDFERALRLLRERGLAKAAKKAVRAATDGAIGAYVHPGGKIGVLIEVNCETDFVAKTPEFQQLVHDLALQVAATAPRYVSREDVPPAELAAEREIYAAQARQQGKPEKVIERIVEGQVERFYQDQCLLEQPFIK